MSCKKKKERGRVLIRKTSAAALPLTRFHGLAYVPEIRARVPISARQSNYLGVFFESSRVLLKLMNFKQN